MPVGNPVTDLSTSGNFVPVTRTLTINGVSYDLSADRSWSIASPGGGSVTSVAMTVPTGFSVAGSPITTAGTLAVTFAAGYALPTTVKQSNWDDAYTWVSNFPTQTGNAGKFLYTNGSVLSWQQALLNPFTVLGQIVYSGVSGSVEVLNGNTTTNRLYLQQVGTGSSSAAPTWGGIISTDITGQALTKTDDTNVTLTLGGTPGNSVLNSVSLTLGWAGTLAVSRGGSGAATLTGVLIGNGTSPFTSVTGGPLQLFRVNASGTGYEFFASNFLVNPMTTSGDIIYGAGAGVPTRLAANGTANNMFLRSVSSGIPSWQAITGADITGAALTGVNDTNVTLSIGGTPATALLRSASLTLGWTGTLSVSRGGSGAATLSGVLIGNGTSAFTAITGGPNQLLRVNSTATGYEFYTAAFLTNPMTLNFDMIYQSGGVPARLPSNTTTTKQFLTSVGNGTATTSLAWAAFTNADVPGAALTSTNDTNVQITLGGTPSTAVLRATSLTMGWTGQLAVGRGGTGAATLTGVVIGNGTANMTAVAGTAGQFLRRNTTNTAYEFRALQGGDIAGSELTFTNDTNIQMSLSGTPASALLQPVGITLLWTGQLAVGRGGTGASTLTGVLIGNGTSAVTAITGTAGQILRRNAANTAYEFFSSSLLTGSGVADRLAIWTSSTNLLDSAITVSGGEVNFASNKLVAGNTSAPNGSIMLQDNYTNGHLGNIGTMYGGGYLMMGYGVTPSTSSGTGFLSSALVGGTPIPRSSIVLGEDILFYTGAAQSVAIGSAVTMVERLKLLNTGQLKLGAYTSSSSFTGIVQGYLGFTSGGLIVTTATPGGVSGTQNYLAKFDSTGIAVGNSRIVDDGTNFLLNGASSVVTGLNLVGNISATDSGGSVVNLRRSGVPTSGQDLAIIDAYGITTGSTYQRGGGIEFRASQNWNSTSAGTEIAISTTPDNTIAPADMFVFLNNGAVRFIGRTSNPIGAAAGTMYYNSSANNMRYYNGTSWIIF